MKSLNDKFQYKIFHNTDTILRAVTTEVAYSHNTCPWQRFNKQCCWNATKQYHEFHYISSPSQGPVTNAFRMKTRRHTALCGLTRKQFLSQRRRYKSSRSVCQATFAEQHQSDLGKRGFHLLYLTFQSFMIYPSGLLEYSSYKHTRKLGWNHLVFTPCT